MLRKWSSVCKSALETINHCTNGRRYYCQFHLAHGNRIKYPYMEMLTSNVAITHERKTWEVHVATLLRVWSLFPVEIHKLSLYQFAF